MRSSRVGEQFVALLEHLDGHEKECCATVGSWMLNGLPVPAGLLAGGVARDRGGCCRRSMTPFRALSR
jgi:hypothetical protein